MDKLPRYVDIDYAKYAPDIPEDQRETYYGLPQKVQFCKECVMSNQKPNSCYEFEHTIHSIKKTMVIQDDGVCDACHACHNKAQRPHRLGPAGKGTAGNSAMNTAKTTAATTAWSPVPAARTASTLPHLLKYKYGMHPLTVTWAPHIYTPWGWDNMQAWIHAGFDNYLCTPNGMTHRLLTRLATENLFHPFQPFILGQKQLAPKMAAKFGIPLVFYGENEAEFGNPIADNNSALRDEHFFAVNDYDHIYLGGVSLRQLEEDYKIDKADLAIYLPSETSNLEKNHVQVRYLGYYEKWHPQGAYYYAVEHGGFRPAPERTQGTYSKYNSIDDKIDDFFYYTTYIKYGIGRTTYDAAQEIRNGEITLDEGKALCKKFDGEYPRPLREGDLQIPVHRQAALPLGQPAVRAAAHGPGVLHAPGRPVPQPASVEVGGQHVEAAPHPLRGRQRSAVGRPEGHPPRNVMCGGNPLPSKIPDRPRRTAS